MKRITAIIAFAVASTTFAQAVKDWESEYKKVGEYDANFIRKLKNPDGTWKRPNNAIAKTLFELRSEIESAGRDLGVDPRAIAGSILAENSMNVDASDTAQDFLTKIGIAKHGSLGGHNFTIGLGQLNFPAARDSENYVATLEHRKPLSDDDLQDAMLDPRKSIRLVGQVLKQVQDVYHQYGFEIGGNPPILATLYNLGNAEKRAKEAKVLGRLPRENYFGLFVDRNTPLLNKITLYQVSAKQKTVKVSGLDSSQLKTKSDAGPPIAIVAMKGPQPKTKPVLKAKNPVSINQRKVLSESIPLFQAPPSCKESGNSIVRKYEAYKNYAVTGIAHARSGWTLIAPAIDCEANPWSLVRMEDGITGWVKSETLKKVTENEYLSPSACKTTLNANCRKNVEKNLNEKLLFKDQSPDQSTLTYLRPIVAEGAKINFKVQDLSCGYKDNAANVIPGFALDSKKEFEKAAVSVNSNVSQRDLIETIRLIKSIKSKLGDLHDVNNVYNAIISDMSGLNLDQECLEIQISASGHCSFDVIKLQQALKAIKVPKVPSLSEAETIRRQLNSIPVHQDSYSSGNPWNAKPEEFDHISRESALAQLESCTKYLEKKTSSFDEYQKRMDAFSQITQEEWQTNINVRRSAANMIKMCAANIDLFYGEKLDRSNSETSLLCNFHYGDVVKISQMNAIKKEIAKKYITQDQIDEALYTDIQKAVPDLNFGKKTKADRIKDSGSYCANRTAEFIEDLLAKNPCVSHVYVPDLWLVSRLNEQGGKILYRPFETDDRYAIDYSEALCK